ncbi:hypothetical protein PMAYCL1PPCAC_31639 [Pristionchus mayeri]|uniref:Unconventional myosin-XV n=1 Tax=Pristionchus mayeri TaxID=1317129 RepID=A0AAN5DE40_9BILA|nr:hypothetical protein PMAYCL1PPCAC_31639 [Pristionchus mayeri]
MSTNEKVIDNLLELEDTSEASMLATLEKRFKRNRIYTKLGNILVTVNPNEKLPIYDQKVIDLYKHEITNEAHIFTAAEQAYLAIREGAPSHNIVFSGESGSGKSHNAMASLRYLAAISSSSRNKICPAVIDALQVVLSSFASAKTMKNDNSTRFGYTVELMYKSSSLEGLSIKETLPLDFSRLANRPVGERNFNVLHQLVAGLCDSEQTRLGIKPDHKFFYLAKDTTDAARDRAALVQLLSALETLGFTEEQRQFILTLLAVVLHTGNLYFGMKRTTKPGVEHVVIANENEAKWIATLLGLDTKKFVPLFTEKKMVSEKETTTHSFTLDKALDIRDSFAAVLYEELFNWMLARISYFFKCNEPTAIVSVLDYYGVERYNQNNSLEQLLVNTANEAVENFILTEIFQKETETYTAEHIKCAVKDQKIPSNGKTLDVLTKRPYGVLPLLDDECKFPKASDDSFLQHCNITHPENGIFGKTKNKDKQEFSIQHFHGTTWYSVNNFLAGNRRSISRSFLELLSESSNVFVSTVFRAMFISRSKDEYTQLAATNLMKSCAMLVEKLKSAPCQFVRCLRTNSEKTKWKWDEPTIARQLRAYSLIDTLEFRTRGYPVKTPIPAFVAKYRCLLSSMITSCQKEKEILTDILDGQGSLFQNDFQIGTTHVFLRERLAERLNRQRKAVIGKSAVIVQKTVKAALCRRRFLKKRAATVKIQAACRGWLGRRDLQRKKTDVIKTLETCTKNTGTLRTYHRTMKDDELGRKKEVSKSLLGPTKYLAEDNYGVRTEEDFEIKKVNYYLTIPAEMQRPTIDVEPIEEFAKKHFRGHLLEVRREPIQTPFLPKETEMEFVLAVEMFKLVLKYTNDASMSAGDLHALARRIVQLAIDNISMRDELFVQLCNQTYRNQNKTFSTRAWTLLLMAVHSFPPTILVLPMLLHYFVKQPTQLSTQLMEGLVRKIRTLDAQAARLYAANRLEYESMQSVHPAVLNVHLPDQDEYLVEAHPWVTAEELALRVMRERGMGDPEGWSVVVETESEIFCPTQGQFVHDAIAAIDNPQKAKLMDEEVDYFFHFPNVRSLPATNSKAATPTRALSPEEKRSVNLPSRSNSFKDSAPPCVATIAIADSPKPPSLCSPKSQSEGSTEEEYVMIRSEEEEISISMKDSSSNQSIDEDRSSSKGSNEGSDEQKREVVLDPANPNSDYCYTLPNKTFSLRKQLEESSTSPMHTYEASENHLYTMHHPTMPSLQTLPRTPMDSRYHEQQAAYATLSQQMQQHPQQVQYIQYVPVVVSQPILPGPLFSPTSMPPGTMPHTTALSPTYGSYQPPGTSIPHGTMPPSATLSPTYGTYQMAPAPYYQPILSPTMCMPQHAPLTAQHSSNSIPFSENDERIRAAMIRQSNGMETPTVMSVASRIRRMPVPSKNSDVDRFLDEVFQQVLPADVGGMDSISSQRIADSIKGGKKAPATRGALPPIPQQQQSIYYDTPPMMMPQPPGHRMMPANPGNYNSLPPMMQYPRVSLNRVSGSLQRDKTKTKEELRRHTDELRRKQFSVSPIQYGTNYIDYPEARAIQRTSSSIDPSVYGERHTYDSTPIYDSSAVLPKAVQRPPDAGSLMYGETAVVSYGDHPPTRKTLVTDENDFAPVAPIAAAAVPTPAPRVTPPRAEPVQRDANVVQGSTLNSEHLIPGKIVNPIRTMAKTMLEKERLAMAKLDARNKIRAPPSDDDDWVRERDVYRPKESQNMLIDRGQDSMDEYHGPAPTQHYQQQETPVFVPRPPQAAPPQKERTAVHALKQPWKLTIRKINFLPGENLDDVQLIDQVFAQIIADCKAANAYRIRAVERDNVTAILKKHQIHPDLLNRQYDIPSEVKVELIEAARKWPLYFNQIFEVVEERATENVFILLAVGETGIRLLVHNHQNAQNPLVIQDHFEFGDIKDVMLEERELLTLRTRTNMLVHLRTVEAVAIRALIEKYLYGSAKARAFVLASSDYITNEPDHLSFAKGQRIELVEKSGVPRGWMHGRIHNRYGIFPSEHVVPEHADERGHHPDVPSLNSPHAVYERRGNDYGYEYAEDEGREKHTMLEFALLYFRPPRGDKRKDWSWKEVAKRVMWTDRPIQQSLLRLEGAEANKLACDVFLNIMKYMGDESLKKGETIPDAVYRIFMMMKRLEILRDEAYCQLIRQTTNNRSESPDSVVRGWRLFLILTSFFDCSSVLKPYLMKHLIDVANDSRRPFHGTAQQCIANLSKTVKYGGRKFLLSSAEILEISKGKTIKRQTYHIPGGHKMVVNTTSVTVVEDVIKELCSDLNIRSPSEQQEFVLCAVLENARHDTHYVKNDEYLLDIATELEHKKTAYTFHLRRAVWLHPLRLDSALYIDCMYYQILPDYQTGLLVSPQNNGHFSAATMDDIAKLAAYVYLGNEEYRQLAIDERMVITMLPHTALTSRIVTADMWVERVERKLRTMDTAISVAHARAAFLEIVEKWPSFGALFYRVLSSTEHDREIAETVISVNRAGLRLLSGDNYRTLAEYALSAIGPITPFTRNNTDYLDITVRGKERDIRLTIQSEKAADIARLIGHYLFVYKTNKSSIASEVHRNH